MSPFSAEFFPLVQTSSYAAAP